MNPVNKYGDQKELAKDAIFFSVHKFIGGVDSPGVLIAKKSLFSNHTPFIPGGGTVFFVSAPTAEPQWWITDSCTCLYLSPSDGQVSPDQPIAYHVSMLYVCR